MWCQPGWIAGKLASLKPGSLTVVADTDAEADADTDVEADWNAGCRFKQLGLLGQLSLSLGDLFSWNIQHGRWL